MFFLYLSFFVVSPCFSYDIGGDWTFGITETHNAHHEVYTKYNPDGTIDFVEVTDPVDENVPRENEIYGGAIQVGDSIYGSFESTDGLVSEFTGSISGDAVVFTAITPEVDREVDEPSYREIYTQTEIITEFEGTYTPASNTITATWESSRDWSYQEWWFYDLDHHYSIEKTDSTYGGTVVITIDKNGGGGITAPEVAFELADSSDYESVDPAIAAVLSRPTLFNVTVDYSVTGGTATGGGVDYTLASGTLTFAPLDTSEDIVIDVVDDDLDENEETITVTLSNPVYAQLGTNTTHTYTILDDDAEISVAWEKTFGGDLGEGGESVQQTSDGGYIVAGFTGSYGAGGGDVYLVKTNSGGEMLWQKAFGGSDMEWGHSVQQTSDGGYIVTGFTRSYGAGEYDVYLVKTDSDGDLQWQKTFGGSDWDDGYSVRQTTDGGYIIAGETYSYGAGARDVYLIKTDSDGGLQWQKTFGGSRNDDGQAVQQTTDGGYIVAGYTASHEIGDGGVYLLKTNSDGEMLWQKTFGGNGVGQSVQQTSDGGYIVAGYTDSYGSGEEDVYVVKTDSDGVLQWERTFGGSGYDYGLSVQQTSDGGYIIAGITDSYGAGSEDVYLVKTNSDGDKLGQRTFGGSGLDKGHSVQQTSDGGYIIAGRTDSFGGLDVYLIKVSGGVSSPTLCDMNWDGFVSIIGDVPPFVNVIYFADYDWYEQQFPGKDPNLPGDCNGDGILSIVGDVPPFVSCAYFDNCPDQESP